MDPRWSFAVLPVLAALVLSWPLAATAQETPTTAPAAAEAEPELDLEALRAQRKQRIARYGVGSRISRYLAKAAEVSETEGPEEAQALLDRLNMRRLNPHERALVYRLRAYISYHAGDQQAAIDYFNQAIDEEILSVDSDNKMRFNIIQLEASRQNWQGVIDAIAVWEPYAEEPAPVAYYLRALSYYQLGNIELAIADAERAIDLSPKPQEGWLQLLAALFVQEKDYAAAAPVLEELVITFPKKRYWMQLSLIYQARDHYKESLAVQQVAYLQGYLTEDKDIRRLARSYLYHDLPHPAAEVLEKGLEDGIIDADVEFYETLANSWIAAREYDRSLPPLLKAAEMSETGEIYVRRAQVHLQREEWDVATEYLGKAIERGGLEDLGNARLLMGIAYYNTGRVDRARSSFMEARRFEKSRPRADSWITHIENETNAG